MAATDTFEWFVATMVKHPSDRLIAQVKAQRSYLLTLRSEDERQRYVDTALAELRELSRH